MAITVKLRISSPSFPYKQVWLSLANFELCAQNAVEEDEGEDGATATATNEAEARSAIERAREIYREANVALRKSATRNNECNSSMPGRSLR